VLDALDRALALRAAPLFHALPAEALLPVARLCTEVDLDPEDELFCEGDLGDSLYVVVSGGVRVVRGKTMLAKLGPGECVGEMAALDWEPRSATVTATAASRLIRLDRNDLLDLLADYPELVRAMATVLVERLRKTS
jgi:CRP-like cAMP-binding protein